MNCSSNQLTSLNVSANTALAALNCSGNQLTSLDASACNALVLLYCSGNQLTSLDVSANTQLTTFDGSFNQLTSLNVKNDNNINMWNFVAYYNPNLSCIEVDDAAWSSLNWITNIDATAYFSEDCSPLGISVNNETKEPMFYPNPTTGNIYLSEPENIALSDFSGKLLLEEKNTKQLDISSLPAGIYFLRFGENNQQIVRVIKE